MHTKTSLVNSSIKILIIIGVIVIDTNKTVGENLEEFITIGKD